MDEGRAAAVAALRERLALLGGPARHAAAPVGNGSAPPPGTAAPRLGAGPGAAAERDTTPAPPPRRPHGDADERTPEAAAGRLGFVLEDTTSGPAWVRRVSVDLGPFLARAGAPAPATARQLLGLAYGTTGEQPEPPFDAEACAVLDIESIGLRGSGVLAFLVGLGVPRGRRLDVDQLLLTDPGAEAALLGALLGRLRPRRLLVTYNGRSFDVPVLRARCVVNRLGGTWLEEVLHCDLVFPVRRLFRDRLGACTLRQAELDLLGLERDGDVGGAEAPGRYRAWLRGAEDAALAAVVRHNQLDLCATAVLAARLAAHVEGRLVKPVHPADRYHLAVHLERLGARETVEEHYRATVAQGRGPWDRRAAHRLARRLRRGDESQRREAAALLRSLWEEEPADLQAARGLSIVAERLGCVDEALEVAERAVEVCAALGAWRLGLLRGAPREGWAVDWSRRRARLQRRRARRAAALPLPLAWSPGTGQRPPPVLVVDGAAVTPPVLTHCAQGICQSASPSE